MIPINFLDLRGELVNRSGQPNITVPALELPDGTFIYDSFRIAECLDDAYPDAPSLFRDIGIYKNLLIIILILDTRIVAVIILNKLVFFLFVYFIAHAYVQGCREQGGADGWERPPPIFPTSRHPCTY
jgi:hypothetical protein